jgi:hypothetical protein
MTAQTISDALPLSGVAPGTYDLRVQITHPSGYLAPMALAIGGRNADGSYSIGSVALP